MIRIKIRRKIDKRKYTLYAVMTFIVILAVWSLVSGLELIEPIFLPTPLSVLKYAIKSARDGVLWLNMGVSVYRILFGFILAIILGIPIGILAGTFKVAEAIIRPLCEFIRYMPVPAFVPLIMVWAGIGETAKILVIFIGTFFQLVLMVADDALSVPDELIYAGYTLGADTKIAVWKILIPAMLPRLMDTLRMMIGWAWTYLVSAELVAASSGLGYSILKAQRFVKTDAIFSGIIIIGILGLVTDRIFAIVNKRLFKWREGGA